MKVESKPVKVDKKALAYDTKVTQLRQLYRLVQKGQKLEALAIIAEMGMTAKRESVAYSERLKRRKTIG